jgi:hypothetical protein
MAEILKEKPSRAWRQTLKKETEQEIGYNYSEKNVT